MITADQLQAFAPAAVPMVAELNAALSKYGISASDEICHFMAQCAHESGGFKRMTENLNYSAEGLKATWPRRFPGDIAESYARNPERIANRVYAGRMGNGDEQSGDGWKYRGRGIIQITGKDNYSALSKGLYGDDRLLSDPSPIEKPAGACMSAAWFWNRHALGVLAKRDDLTNITRTINGGLHGLEERGKWLGKARGIFL